MVISLYECRLPVQIDCRWENNVVFKHLALILELGPTLRTSREQNSHGQNIWSNISRYFNLLKSRRFFSCIKCPTMMPKRKAKYKFRNHVIMLKGTQYLMVSTLPQFANTSSHKPLASSLRPRGVRLAGLYQSLSRFHMTLWLDFIRVSNYQPRLFRK